MKVKKVLGYLYKAFVYLLIALFIYVIAKVLLAYVTNTRPSLFNHYFFVVETESMSPNINPGDIVFVKIADISTIKVDDVIAFKCIDPSQSIFGESIIHRVVSIEDGFVITTKGDAVSSADTLKVTSNNYIGIVSYVSKTLGSLYKTFASTYLLLYIVILAILLNVIKFFIKKIIEIRKEENEKEKVKQEILNEMKGNKDE